MQQRKPQSNEHTTQWEKIFFPSYTPNRGLVSRIYKKLKTNQTNTQSGHQENKQHNYKLAEKLNFKKLRHIFLKTIQHLSHQGNADQRSFLLLQPEW